MVLPWLHERTPSPTPRRRSDTGGRDAAGPGTCLHPMRSACRAPEGGVQRHRRCEILLLVRLRRESGLADIGPLVSPAGPALDELTADRARVERHLTARAQVDVYH